MPTFTPKATYTSWRPTPTVYQWVYIGTGHALLERGVINVMENTDQESYSSQFTLLALDSLRPFSVYTCQTPSGGDLKVIAWADAFGGKGVGAVHLIETGREKYQCIGCDCACRCCETTRACCRCCNSPESATGPCECGCSCDFVPDTTA